MADQYQFRGNLHSQSAASGSGIDDVDGIAMENPGMTNGADTVSTATDLLKNGAGNLLLVIPITADLHKYINIMRGCAELLDFIITSQGTPNMG